MVNARRVAPLTRETAEALSRLPRSYPLEEAERALSGPAFVGLDAEGEVFAGGGILPDKDGAHRAWIVVPAIGFRNLRWAREEMAKFLARFNKPVRASIAEDDGAGYVFATSLGFTNVIGIEVQAGRNFIILERAL